MTGSRQHRFAVLFAAGALCACARWDVREALPAQRLLEPGPQNAAQVAVAPGLLEELPPPPGMDAGLGSMLPAPLGSLMGSLPLLGGILTPHQSPRWLEDARRSDLLTPRLISGILGAAGAPLTGSRPVWALSNDAAAMAAARDQGARFVLTVQAALGPEDQGTPLPRRITAQADAALLDPYRAVTVARAYDRVSILVGGGRDALPAALRRAGAQLGQRLQKQLGLELEFPSPQAKLDSEGEEEAEDVLRR